MNPLFKYVLNEKEESALISLCTILGFRQDEFFLSTKPFLENKSYYNDSDEIFEKLKGFGSTKIQSLKQVYERVIRGEETSYYSTYEYSMAKKRYESLAKRNFERLIFENFYTNIFSQIYEAWMLDLGKSEVLSEESQVMKKLVEEKYVPDTSWLIGGASSENLKAIKAIYDDMKVVRFRNILQDHWEEIHRKTLKKLFNIYLNDNFFGKSLPQELFFNFYGNNNALRSCQYCKITEPQIALLFSNNNIFTKRIYSRGMSMEVDKQNPAVGYQLGNLIMSCYWCNNAKTDEFTEEEFLKIAKEISQVWSNRLKAI